MVDRVCRVTYTAAMDVPELRAFRDRINLLLRTTDPVRANQLASELLNESRPVFHAVRRQAARDAKAAGTRPADYARQIGVTRAAVGHLLREQPATTQELGEPE